MVTLYHVLKGLTWLSMNISSKLSYLFLNLSIVITEKCSRLPEKIPAYKESRFTIKWIYWYSDQHLLSVSSENTSWREAIFNFLWLYWIDQVWDTVNMHFQQLLFWQHHIPLLFSFIPGLWLQSFPILNKSLISRKKTYSGAILSELNVI